MISKKVKVQLANGIHAFNVIKLRKLIQGSNCLVFIENKNGIANCKDIITLLRLNIKAGQTVKVLCDGVDEDNIMEKVVNFLQNK